MKIIKYVIYGLFFILYSISDAQTREVASINSCQYDFFYHYLYPKYGKAFVNKHFLLDEDRSSFNYIDAETNKRYLNVELKDSDTINGSPNEYTTVIKISHQERDIGFIKLRCHYYDNVIRSEKIKSNELEKILKPYLKVIKGKVMGLKKILSLARQKGYSKVSEWHIDYERNEKNEYKWFFPRLIWKLKEKLKNNNNENYYRVIELNARNGKILKESIEYEL